MLGQKDLTEKAENVWCKEKKKLNKRDDDTKDKRRRNTQNRLKISKFVVPNIQQLSSPPTGCR